MILCICLVMIMVVIALGIWTTGQEDQLASDLVSYQLQGGNYKVVDFNDRTRLLDSSQILLPPRSGASIFTYQNWTEEMSEYFTKIRRENQHLVSLALNANWTDDDS